MTSPIRRLFYAAGAADYHLDRNLGPLEGVKEDLVRMTALFAAELTYEPRPQVPLLNSRAEAVRRSLVSQDDEPFTESDTVVVYYAGHGEHIGDRHYLMCPDSDRARPTSTALPTEDLVRIFTERKVRRLLLIVDTCYAARGAADSVREVAQQVAVNMGRQKETFSGKMISFSVISAARKYQTADESAFRIALEETIKSGECGGIRSRKLALETVVEAVSEKLKEQGHGQQDATLATLLSDRDNPPFLPNRRYDPEAPHESISVAELKNWALQSMTAAEKKAAAESYFIGCTAALHRLRDRVFETADTSRPLAVTGTPGVGKSALLAEFWRLTRAETGEPGAPPPVTVALINARDKSRADIVAEIAAAEGVDSGTTYGALISLLRGRLRPFVLLVDAVGEAPERQGSRRPQEIAELLRELAELPMLRVITAVPADLLTDLRPGEHLDLDEPRWNSKADLHAYTTWLLRNPYGPGSEPTCPADEAPQRARAIVARAGCNRLLIRLLAQRTTAAYEPPPDLRDPDIGLQAEKLPTVGMVFRQAVRERCRDADEVETVEALLRGLAFSHGAGLPWGGRLWPRVMAKVFNAGKPLRGKDIQRLLEVAGPFLVETLDSAGRTVYRLYHETFAEELRTSAPKHAREAIVKALREEISERYREQPDRPVDPYVHNHLPAHARDVGGVGDLLQDPFFLLTTDLDTVQKIRHENPEPSIEAEVALDFVTRKRQAKDRAAELAFLRVVAMVWKARTLLRRIGDLGLPSQLGQSATVMTIACTGRVAHSRQTSEDGRHQITVQTSAGGDLLMDVLRASGTEG
ncbi:caspase family protein [Streptomyces sp. NPDC059272]|uniref:caspase family protein n=1 Tax=Streptomyces sp. NPDC059272 TaxID=3346800 RepID=UPI0036945308